MKNTITKITKLGTLVTIFAVIFGLSTTFANANTSPAYASNIPVTVPATDITSTSATLHGYFFEDAPHVAEYWTNHTDSFSFQYGTTQAFGSEVPAGPSILCIKAPCPSPTYHAGVSHLNSGTNYYYRFVRTSTPISAASSVQRTYGDTHSFKTPGTTQTTVTITKNLYWGMSNAQVTTLQEFLIQKGYLVDTTATGYFGFKTFKAVKAFQKAYNIPPTGYVGPLTRAQINSLLGSPSVVTERFEGTITANSTACSYDGECSITVDGKKIVINIGRSQEIVGSATGDITIGAHAEVFAKKTGEGDYTLYGDANYYIKITPTNPGVTVLSPNGAEVWDSNSVHTITWKLADTLNANTKLDLYVYTDQLACTLQYPSNCNNGIFTLDKNIPSTTNYNWIVGTDVNNALIPANTYKVKICLAGTDKCDVSDGEFQIKAHN